MRVSNIIYFRYLDDVNSTGLYSRYVMIIDFRENWNAIAAIFKGQQYWRSLPNSELFCWNEVGVTLRQGADRFNPLQPEYHLPFYIELKTIDHRATLTALERNLGLRKVTTHSGGWTLKSTQETTRGDQEVFSYQQLRQRSITATFQEHPMQFRPCAQMTVEKLSSISSWEERTGTSQLNE